MTVTYDELQLAIRNAAALHRLTNNGMLPSAIAILAAYLGADDADAIELDAVASKSYAIIEQMMHAKDILYGCN